MWRPDWIIQPLGYSMPLLHNPCYMEPSIPFMTLVIRNDILRPRSMLNTGFEGDISGKLLNCQELL